MPRWLQLHGRNKTRCLGNHITDTFPGDTRLKQRWCRPQAGDAVQTEPTGAAVRSKSDQ